MINNQEELLEKRRKKLNKAKENIEATIDDENSYLRDLKNEKKESIEFLKEIGIWTYFGITIEMTLLWMSLDNIKLSNIISEIIKLLKYTAPLLTIPTFIASNKLINVISIKNEEKKTKEKIIELNEESKKIEIVLKKIERKEKNIIGIKKEEQKVIEPILYNEKNNEKSNKIKKRIR